MSIVSSAFESSVRESLVEYCFIESEYFSRLNGFLSRPGRQVLEVEETLEANLNFHEDKLNMTVWIVSSFFLKENCNRIYEWHTSHPDFDIRIIVLATQKEDKNAFDPLPPEFVHLVLPINTEGEMVAGVTENAYKQLQLRYEKLKLQTRLALSYQDIKRITRVGQAMATERDFDRLIGLVLQQAREMVSADGGSIYVVERKPPGEKTTHIRFKQSALHLRASEFLLPIDRNSIAGYVAMTGELLVIDNCYELSGDENYQFNYEFDKAHNYYTKSMMLIPMKNHYEDVIGVIQLINRKVDFHAKLTMEEMKGEAVQPFSAKDIELIMALAGQAGVALENSFLVQDIENLFEGFVKASVTAIEQRDPTTSGHSFRVSELTVGLARAVDRISDGPFRHVKFGRDQIRELRYASLLHDFGKVGVQEKVLVKEKKLFDTELELIKWRFMYIRKALEAQYANKKLAHIKKYGTDGFDELENVLSEELQQKKEHLTDMYRTIIDANVPQVLAQGNFEKLESIACKSFRLDDGTVVPFLADNELVSLSVRRGNLNEQERLEIESHVTHTYRFLIQIPWTRDLSRVAEIARSHHEKLNGTGYPLGLRAEDISQQTRMMTIADIFDALTAPDRPYKKSMKSGFALDILRMEVKDNHLDGRLLDIFVNAKIYDLISRSGETGF